MKQLWSYTGNWGLLNVWMNRVRASGLKHCLLSGSGRFIILKRMMQKGFES